MKRRKNTLLSLLILFSLTLALTDFCAAMLFYPPAVKAAEPVVDNHLGCGEMPEAPIAKIKLSAAAAGGNLMPCCVGQSRDNDFALIAAETPLTLTTPASAPGHDQILDNSPLRGYVATFWPPPEQIIIKSVIIRV